MQTSYLRGVLFCLVATVSWGCMFPVMTSALTQMDPFNFTAIRYTIAAIPFAVLLLAREGKGAFNLKGERHLLAWLFGTTGFAGFNFLIFLGQQLAGPTGALSAAIMTATMPLLALPVNWVMRGVRPPLYSIGFILLAFVGVVLVITKGNPLGAFDQAQSYIADITLFVGALSWVIYTSGASLFPTWSPYRYTAMTTLLGLVSVYAINVVLIELRYIPVPSSGQAWTIMPQFLYMSLVAGAIGVLSWNMGNKIITPVNGVLFMNVVPVAAFAVSALSGIVPTPVQLAGAAITVAALVMNNLYQRQRVQRESASPQQLPRSDGRRGSPGGPIRLGAFSRRSQTDRQYGRSDMARSVENCRQSHSDIFVGHLRIRNGSVVTGTNDGPYEGRPATGKKLVFSTSDFFRIENGKIAERWDVVDTLARAMALGLVPSPTASAPTPPKSP